MSTRRPVRLQQNRSRKAGHKHALNIQDFPPLNLTAQERAIWKFCNVVALLANEGGYYELLPPAARMATDAVKLAAAQLEKAKKG